jgi:hypothetical protein
VAYETRILRNSRLNAVFIFLNAMLIGFSLTLYRLVGLEDPTRKYSYNL